MKYSILICFSVIFVPCQSVSDFYWESHKNKPIILLESNDTDYMLHSKINSKFCDFLLEVTRRFRCPLNIDDNIFRYYFGDNVEITKISGGVNITLSYIKDKDQKQSKEPIVNLRVHDFFTLNYNDYKDIHYIIDENALHEVEQQQEVCKINVKNKREPCEIVKEPIKNVIIVNDVANKNTELMDIIKKFINKKPIFIVLICGNDHEKLKGNAVDYYVVIYSPISLCTQKIEQYNKDLLAVITKATENYITHVTDALVVFIEADHEYLENKNITPNAIYPYLIKQNFVSTVIVNFLLEMDWQRVAIVSDNSLDSYIFREKLIQEMDIHYMVYYETQLNSDNDFSTILQSLKYENARIIIANIQVDKLQELIDTIQQYGMISPVYIWIFRVSFSKMTDIINPYTDVFLVYFDDTDTNLNFLNSFGFVNTYVKNATNYYTDIKDKAVEQYSNFKARIVQLQKDNSYRTILEMNVHNGRVGNVKKRASPYEKVPLDSNCIMRSNEFLDCRDDLLIILVSVVVMFLLFVGVIFLFFDDLKTNNQYKTMDNMTETNST